MTMVFLDVATTVCVGLLIGTEFSVSAFVNPVVWKLDEGAQSQAIAMFARLLGTVMPFWYGLSLLLLLAETAIRWHQAGVLLSAASGIWVAVIVLTLLFLVPINNRMMDLDPDSFSNAARGEHRKWDAMHRARVLALSVAMVCFLIAVRG
jgi:uncharacterized membrane protein